jgi:hypothetical protein
MAVRETSRRCCRLPRAPTCDARCSGHLRARLNALLSKSSAPAEDRRRALESVTQSKKSLDDLDKDMWVYEYKLVLVASLPLAGAACQRLKLAWHGHRRLTGHSSRRRAPGRSRPSCKSSLTSNVVARHWQETKWSSMSVVTFAQVDGSRLSGRGSVRTSLWKLLLDGRGPS